MPPQIVAKSLSFSYQEELILKDVSFTISKGEFIGIFGPNGGGKTTLLRLLLNLESPTSGSVTIQHQANGCHGCEVAYVPQITRFDKAFPITVLEVVLMGLLHEVKWSGRYSKTHKKNALEALEKVGLKSFADARFGSLSGGQAQRALFARALVTNPNILILDEPTASIDPVAEETIHQLIEAEIGKKTIIMVTHDLDKISKKIDRAFCVYQTVREFTPKELCSHQKMGIYHKKEKS